MFRCLTPFSINVLDIEYFLDIGLENYEKLGYFLIVLEFVYEVVSFVTNSCNFLRAITKSLFTFIQVLVFDDS